MFGFIAKVVETVVKVPVAVAADVATLGGALTDEKKPYTAQVVEKLVEEVKK